MNPDVIGGGSPGSVLADGSQPPPAPDSSKQPQQVKETSPSEALFDAIKGLPYVGPWFVWIIKQFGWKGLILFATGAVVGMSIALGLVFFGRLPGWFVSDDYAKVNGITELEDKSQPLQGDLDVLEMNDLSKMEMWLLDYRQFFLSSAATLHDGGVKVFQLKSVIPRPTGKSKWFLDLGSDSNYMIEDGRGFRVTRAGLVEPLTIVDSATRFNVPPCQQGDTLRAIVVYRRKENATNDSPPEFRSYSP